MAKLADMSLDELYSRPKITGAVLDIIQLKEDFTKRSDRYCNLVCNLSCKRPEQAFQGDTSRKVDVVFLQSHHPLDEKFKTGDKLHRGYWDTIRVLLPKDITFKVINVLRCKVELSALKGRSSLAQKTILNCAPYALEDIRASAPKIIVATTADACKALGLTKMSPSRNLSEIHISPILGIPVLITLHPRLTQMIRQNASGGMWGYEYYGVIMQDISTLTKYLKQGLVLPDRQQACKEAAGRVYIARHIDQVKDAVQKLGSAAAAGKVLSFDIETTGLDGWADDAKILTVQFGFRFADGQVRAYVIPLWHRENKGYNPDEAWELVKPLLEDTNVKKIGHNVKFDMTYVYACTGVRVRGVVFDTMLLIHSLNSGVSGTYGLKQSVWRYLPETGLGGYEDALGEEVVEEGEDGSES